MPFGILYKYVSYVWLLYHYTNTTICSIIKTEEKDKTTYEMKGAKIMKENNMVITFNNEGKVLYRDYFPTAERAYEEYVAIIGVLKRRLSKGEVVNVARYRDGSVMTVETVEGTC